MVMVSNSKTLQVILDAPGLMGKKVTTIQKDGPTALIHSIVSNNQELKESFYVLDLARVASLMDRWTRSLPTIRPFYAVKCNPDPTFLSAMAALGASFDCASRAEIQTVLSLGVSPDRIIFANPCKAETHIKYAAGVGINLTTFDSSEEVEKIRKYFTLATNIIGKRVRGEVREYWINDGVYGSMNCLFNDHAILNPTPFAWSSNRGNPTCRGVRTYCSTVFGPTCDALDTVLVGYQLPELQVNDWLVFPNMGAYAAAAGSNFNGFNTAAITTHLAYSSQM